MAQVLTAACSSLVWGSWEKWVFFSSRGSPKGTGHWATVGRYDRPVGLSFLSVDCGYSKRRASSGASGLWAAQTWPLDSEALACPSDSVLEVQVFREGEGKMALLLSPGVVGSSHCQPTVGLPLGYHMGPFWGQVKAALPSMCCLSSQGIALEGRVGVPVRGSGLSSLL